MLYLALTFCILMPIFGVAAMEDGAVSPFISEAGSPNGATVAYFIHVMCFFAGFLWIINSNQRKFRIKGVVSQLYLSRTNIDYFAYLCATLFILLTLVLLFGYGAVNVLTLNMDKADFRVSLGPFGPIITLARNWYVPAFFAILVRICIDFGWTRKRIMLTLIAFLALCMFGVANGFKTTILNMLLPAFIVAAWKINLRLAFLGFILLATNLIGLGMFLDGHGAFDIALEALWYRLTVLQSDLTWFTWQKATEGKELPDYVKTFLPIFGDSIFRILSGVDPENNYEKWASYYYGLSMTLFGGYPVEGILAGVNNQATLFAETVVIGGAKYFPIFSFLFGLFAGKIAAILKNSIALHQYARMGFLSTFFSFPVLMWTLGNGFSSLFYLLNIFGGISTYMAIRILLPIRIIRNDKILSN